MRIALGTIIVACFASWPAVANAQVVDPQAAPVAGGHLIPAMVRGEQLKPTGSFYVGGYSTSEGSVPINVHFYEHRQGGETAASWTTWALREVGTGSGVRLEWLDGASCAGIYGVQRMLADRFAPRFREPRPVERLPTGARTLPGPPIVVDGGSTVAIWGYAVHADGARGAMIVTGQEGSIQDWARFANEQLAPCWSEHAPTFLQNR